MSVRAKFVCVQNDSEIGGNVKLECQYDGELTAEDRAFHKATPWGSVEMNIDNEPAAKFFEVGKAYYADFSPAE